MVVDPQRRFRRPPEIGQVRPRRIGIWIFHGGSGEKSQVFPLRRKARALRIFRNRARADHAAFRVSGHGGERVLFVRVLAVFGFLDHPLRTGARVGRGTGERKMDDIRPHAQLRSRGAFDHGRMEGGRRVRVRRGGHALVHLRRRVFVNRSARLGALGPFGLAGLAFRSRTFRRRVFLCHLFARAAEAFAPNRARTVSRRPLRAHRFGFSSRPLRTLASETRRPHAIGGLFGCGCRR